MVMVMVMVVVVEQIKEREREQEQFCQIVRGVFRVVCVGNSERVVDLNLSLGATMSTATCDVSFFSHNTVDKYPDMIPLSSPTPGNDNIATSDGLEPGSNPPIQMPVSAISTS
ncbi:hypothetical protein TWF102_003392 [Orbilia oligospora]|uniref:Uncharacterized protein n=1 Tax=Orbilia oligospora TaxID=2813651 RepID=A0A7C8JNJ2_ORBOL|nr:hypothetical protein TWF102_003392 [Orbilia oligospora]KAF3104679.1 hypothetical protein TWF706_004464 [Orbilia oligospora]KAF3115374.1 hypothetical protein TWF103_010804 [Orbilia oligospora]KAF3139702.1 hypothetical protein TWF594_006564 [Orbilia oligospora]